MADESSTSLNRAIAILTVLGSPEVTEGDGIGVVGIARIIGREKSQVSRTLKVLAESGMVSRDPETLRYTLGWRLFTLASGAGDQRLRALAPHVLRRLVARVHESAHLSVMEAGGVHTLMSERPSLAIYTAPWIGRSAPLYCTSAGRALLFDHTDSEIRSLLEGTVFTTSGPNAGPRAPGSVDEVLTRLRQARCQGYATVDEEFELGHVAVAAPVRDFRGRVVAALNISAPKFRLDRSLAAVGREVKAAADHLSQALVCPPPSETAPAAPALPRGPSAPAPHHRRIS